MRNEYAANHGPQAVPEPSSLKSAARTIKATRGRARQFWGVFDRSLVPMVTVDNDRSYTAANRAARLLFRLSLAEMKEHTLSDFTPPHMRLLLEDAWSRLMRDGSVASPFDVRFLDGSELRIIYCAIANALPGAHLIVFAPADWPEDELGLIAVVDSDPALAPLSPREREVLTLIAAGADLEQIGGELSISVHTVRTHVLNAYHKLGANNRAHAIALAMQQGLIDLPPATGAEEPTLRRAAARR
jgi:DNA-binding CsgD family transcriptional regulator